MILKAILSVIAAAFWLAVGCTGQSATGSRLLVLVEDAASANATYSTFFAGLQDRGFKITIREPKPDLRIFSYDERNYDHLVLFSQKLGGDVSVANLLEFVNKGGNILLAASSEISDAVKEFALEFSVDFDDKKTQLMDFFHVAGNETSAIYSSNFGSKALPILSPAENPTDLLNIGSVVFRGVTHRQTGKNPLLVAVLHAEDTAFSIDPSISNGVIEPSSPFVSTNNVLVSALQTRENSRVVFAGSSEMFSDKFFKMSWTKDEIERESGNKFVATELAKWVFQEKRVLKIKSSVHHREGETQSHGRYRIKDKMTQELRVSEWFNGKWNPFVAGDIQFEAVMLDPYVRKTMSSARVAQDDPTSTKYLAFYKLPDQYGVFTLKVDYKRHGYSWIETKDVVEVRPFRHNEYPRFLSVAYPYYVNSFAMMFGFLLISGLFLFHKDVVPKATKSKKNQ